MARTARIKETYGIFYIHQTSSGERPLFSSDEDRAYFLGILKRAQKKFGFKLYAYCMLSPSAYHLVLDPNGTDLSNIMKSINIGYAMYVKCEHPLFRDRYKSTLLTSSEAVQLQIQKIHKQSDSPFNSFCHYDLEHPLPLDWISALTPDAYSGAAITDGSGMVQETDCKTCITTLREAKSHLSRLAKEDGKNPSELLKDKACRNQLIKDFRKQSTLSLKELGELFGGLSESSICKILNN